jgi:type III secretory pathway component EscU
VECRAWCLPVLVFVVLWVLLVLISLVLAYKAMCGMSCLVPSSFDIIMIIIIIIIIVIVIPIFFYFYHHHQCLQQRPLPNAKIQVLHQHRSRSACQTFSIVSAPVCLLQTVPIEGTF